MTWIEALPWVGVALVGAAGSWFCSGMETGLYSLNRVRLDIRRAHERRARVLSKEMDRLPAAIATLLIWNNIFNYLQTRGLSSILEGAGLSAGAIIAINAAILTPVLLVVCESLPKETFRIHAERWVYAFSGVLRVLRVAATVTLALPAISLIGAAVSRMLRSSGEAVLPMEPRRRIAALLQEGAAQGALSASQATLVERALSMRDATVGDEMVPWARVRTVRMDWDRTRLLDFLSRQPHSHLPVVDAKGQCVGVLWQVSVFLKPDAPWNSLLAPATIIPAEASLIEGMRMLREDAAGLGLVRHDARIVGVVTPKDLIEPLTGELASW